VPVLAERFIDALNDQIAREFAAAHQYTAIGAWYAAETYPQLARYFYGQAEEERRHAMKMVEYLLDRDARVDFGAIESPTTTFSDHVAPVKAALEQEREVSISINELVQLARDTKDFQSEQFLDWFLQEQVEEESSITDLLAVAERTRDIPMLLEEYLAREVPGGGA
jgi:bacterioferritin B